MDSEAACVHSLRVADRGSGGPYRRARRCAAVTAGRRPVSNVGGIRRHHGRPRRIPTTGRGVGRGIASDGPGLYVVAATPSPGPRPRRRSRARAGLPVCASRDSHCTAGAVSPMSSGTSQVACRRRTRRPGKCRWPCRTASSTSSTCITTSRPRASAPAREPERLDARREGDPELGRGMGDLAPFTPAPPGGTAAMTHIVTASLRPGGPAVATIDTTSPDTTWSVDAPPGNYWLRVAARNQFGTSAPSNEVMVQVSPSAPGPPTARPRRRVGPLGLSISNGRLRSAAGQRPATCSTPAPRPVSPTRHAACERHDVRRGGAAGPLLRAHPLGECTARAGLATK